MEGLELRALEYFLVVAEELHFGRAAARLHIAQPSLSQQIRKLEDQLGTTLFDRSSRRVELTAAGEALVREGGKTLRQAKAAVRAARRAATDQLTVGFFGSAGERLPEVLKTYAERRPNVEVTVRELLLGSVQDIVEGTVDVAFTRLRPGQAELEIQVIASQPRVAALAMDHPLAKSEELAFADLRELSFITNRALSEESVPLRWLAEQRRHGLPGRVAADAASIQEILTLVAAGRGVCLVPAPVAQQYPRRDVAYVPVADAEPAVVSLAWRGDDARPALRAFLDVARELAGRAGG
ncbi:MAG: LysR family transcriptional regulator [Solirubrobacterales bacterium]|nr:LysR family transcriptional regulator [Solirubrobacterales bacterium]